MASSTRRAHAVTSPSVCFDFNTLKVNALNIVKGVTNKLHFPSLKGNFNVSSSEVQLNIFPSSELSKKIQEISRRVDATGSVLSATDQEKCIEAINSDKFKTLKGDLSKIIGKLNERKLNSLLIELFKHCSENPLPVINKLKSLLTLQKIDSVVGFSSVKEAERMSDFVAQEYQTISDEKKQTYLRTALVFVENILEWFIDTFKMAFALNDMGGEVDDPAQASMRVMMLFSLWGSVNTWLLSLSAMLGSAALTATVVSIGLFMMTAALVIYNKWLKPTPEHCAPFLNLTTEAAKGNIAKGVIQDDVIKMIVQTLCANTESTRRYPVLVGPPGSGKSVIIRDFVAMMNAGKIPELKGAKFFLGVGTDLLPDSLNKVNKNRSVDNLSKFYNVTKGKNAILGIDELHAGGAGLEKLKTFLDAGPGGLRYFMGATTPAEYEKFIAGNHALERRLEIIPVGEPNKETTILILKVMARHEAEDIDVEDDVFDQVYSLSKKHFPELAQPAEATGILTKAFSRVRSFRQNSLYAETLRNLRSQRSMLSNDYMRCMESRTHTNEIDALHQKLKRMDMQIEHAEKILKEEMDKYDSFAKLKIQLNELKRDIHMMAIKIARGSISEDYIKEFAFKQNFVKPALDNLIAEKQKFMPKGSVKVDSALISEIIHKKIENKEKSKKKIDPALEEAYAKTKRSITEMAVKISNGTATGEEVEKLKTYKDYVLPALQEAMKG